MCICEFFLVRCVDSVQLGWLD